jgi:DMSO/TMAO reductase YedYZ heme-binding membrane subunit
VSKTRSVPWWLFAANVVVLACLAWWLISTYGYNAEGMVWYTRWTARVSFTFFTLAFVASAIVRLSAGDVGKWLLRNRRYLGLNFALAHGAHLAALIRWHQMTGIEVEPVTILLGGLAYVLAALMAVTSNDFSVRKLGRNWRRLHLFGVWYLWVVFTYTFLGQALEKPAYWVVVIVALLAARLRLRVLFREARKKTETS